MSRLDREKRRQKRTAQRDANEFPGTVAFYDEATKTYGPAYCAAVVISPIEMEHENGGFITVRGASITLTHEQLPTLPAMKKRPRIQITRAAYPGQSEEMRLHENHDQSPGVWHLRASQWRAN